jgi:hypothetical protein
MGCDAADSVFQNRRKFSSAVEQDPYTVKVKGSIPLTSTSNNTEDSHNGIGAVC